MKLGVFSIFLLPLMALAEYRVFQLQLRNPANEVTKEFQSTLDPLQYPTYHPVPQGFFLTYSDTWMCKGRTNEKELCPNPKTLAPSEDSIPAQERSPASEPPSP